MLSSLRNMFRVPDLRNKILFTLVIIAVYRLGAHLPVPGVDLERGQAAPGPVEAAAACVGFLDLFSGGALTSVAIFVLGIMPYITASIIMQLLGVVIPKLEQWQKEGAVGQRKITQWTRYLTIGLALMQSTGLVFVLPQRQAAACSASRGFQGIDLIPQLRRCAAAALIVLTLDAGTALLMWLGELITQRGIGNGMSILIFASVVVAPAGAGLARSGAEGSKFQFFAIIADRHRHARRRSCSSSRASAASRCSSPNGWSAAACTAARAPTSR